MLEIYPAVTQWLSVKIGHRPQGLRNIEESWREWINATRTPLTPNVILAGRNEEQTKVLRWLRDSPQQLSVQAEAPDEALAFLYASISPLPEEYKLFYWRKCVVVDNATTARQLASLGTTLIIVLTISESGIAQSEICRQNGISNATYYNRKSKYGGMEAADIKKLKELEDENTRLKRLFAKVSLENHAMKELFAKKKAGDDREKDLRSGVNSGRLIGHNCLSVSFIARNLFLPDKH